MSGTVNARETPTSVRLSTAIVETRDILVFSCSCLYLLLLHHVGPQVVRQWSTTLLIMLESARYDDKEDGGLLLCIFGDSRMLETKQCTTLKLTFPPPISELVGLG
jgi:hypothetical protein